MLVIKWNKKKEEESWNRAYLATTERLRRHNNSKLDRTRREAVMDASAVFAIFVPAMTLMFDLLITFCPHIQNHQ